jgi:hypothetical protein
VFPGARLLQLTADRMVDGWRLTMLQGAPEQLARALRGRV